MIDRYTCTPISQIRITFEASTTAIGPAGDVLHLPLRVTGGCVTAVGPPKAILCGTDFLEIFADEKLVHHGNLVVGDPAGDILLWYGGISQAQEGAYDDLMEGRLPEQAPSRLSVRIVSTNSGWKALNKKPLIGVGFFRGTSGTLEFTLLSLTENEALN